MLEPLFPHTEPTAQCLPRLHPWDSDSRWAACWVGPKRWGKTGKPPSLRRIMAIIMIRIIHQFIESLLYASNV